MEKMQVKVNSFSTPSRRQRALIIAILLFFVGSSFHCAASQAGIATSNIPLEGKKYDNLGNAETSVSWLSFDIGILGFPLEKPPVDEALQTLLREKGGDALINLRYSTDRIIFPLFTMHRFHLKAEVIKLK